jgi:hypothetical protein
MPGVRRTAGSIKANGVPIAAPPESSAQRRSLLLERQLVHFFSAEWGPAGIAKGHLS